MLNEKLNCGVFVISHRRAHNVEAITKMIGPATWVVGEGQRQAYQDAGAAAVHVGGGLCASRNVPLVWSETHQKPAVQLSDDLKRIQRVHFLSDKSKRVENISFSEALCLMLGRLRESPFRLGGVAPTSNAFFTNKPTQIRHFIIGDFVLTLPAGLRFDEQMTLKEDYDFTLQHIAHYGGVIRNDDILCEFLHYKNAGGAVDCRTAEEEQKNITFLKRKWGAAIRDNPKRPNEILLKLK